MFDRVVLINAFRHSLFPLVHCPSCGGYIDEQEICVDCLATIESLRRCKKCGELLSAGGICSNCNSNFVFRYSLSPLPYEGVLRDNILKYKYQGKTYFARPFAKLLEVGLKSFANTEVFDALIPIPLNSARLKERGYNQAELIGNILSRKIGVPCITTILSRKKDTSPLMQLNKKQRKAVLKDAFEAEPHGFKNILLLDDIYTTGATAAECGKALVNSGAGKVSLLTVARTLENY